MGHLQTCLMPLVRRSGQRCFASASLRSRARGIPTSASTRRQQVQKGRLREGQIPARGVVEVKGVGDDAWLTADGEQVSRYWSRYQLVLVTNTRDFVLVGNGCGGPSFEAGNVPAG